jgi:hypothetical protein
VICGLKLSNNDHYGQLHKNVLGVTKKKTVKKEIKFKNVNNVVNKHLI